MTDGMEIITDRSLFKNILDRFFFNRTSYIHSQKGNIEVTFVDSSNGLVKLQMPVSIEEPKNCIAFTRQGQNIIFVFLKLCEQKTKNVFLFNPAKFQVMRAERMETRESLVKASKHISLIYITRFISDKIINTLLRGQEDKLKRVKEIIKYDNYKKFEYLRIYFCNEGIDDARMKYFISSRTPILIRDFSSQSNDEDCFMYYKNMIKINDSYLQKHSEFISEISVPVLFDSKIPYGYIQVNKSSPFPASAVPYVERLAVLADQLIRRNKIFPVPDDKLLVSDVSQKGIGVVFKNQKYIPYYKKDSSVSLVMLLPKSKKASILADVRHLEVMQNKVIKVGFEIKDMDNVSRDNYDRFLSSITV